ncbi:hypothetical protein [Desulfosarcina variabilis]|uniref:hypothetical protein n=1 Tax=Desulfosarcina variabilis TaxID=2300 RepID=UPI003AFA7D89
MQKANCKQLNLTDEPAVHRLRITDHRPPFIQRPFLPPSPHPPIPPSLLSTPQLPITDH